MHRAAIVPDDEVTGARCQIELAEAQAESDQLGVGEVLIAKQKHLMLEPGPPDRAKRFVVDPPEIDADHFRGEHGARWNYLESVRHATALVLHRSGRERCCLAAATTWHQRPRSLLRIVSASPTCNFGQPSAYCKRRHAGFRQPV